MFLVPCAAWANWGVVQQTESTFVRNTTNTAQFASNVTAGDLILVHAIWGDGTSTINSISDTLGNSFVSAVGPARGFGAGLGASTQLFYAANAVGGTDKITVTLSASTYFTLFVYEIAGAATSNPLDVTATGNGTGTLVTTGTAVTTAANDFVFVGTGHHFASEAAGSGFTGLMSNVTGLSEYQTVGSAGVAVSGASVLSATTASYPWAALLAAFKINPASSSSGTPTLTFIQVSPFSPTLSMGQMLQLFAIGTFSDGSTQDLTASAAWGSSNTAVATLSNPGLVTAAGHGTATITCTSGSISGSTPLIVEGTLSSIQVTPANDTINVGTGQQFTATATFSDGTSESLTGSVSWTSSNTSVATINTSGMATGVSAGSATITASSGSVTGSTGLTIAQPAGGVPAPVTQSPLVQTNFEWAGGSSAQSPPPPGASSSCTPAPCVAQTFLNANASGNMIFAWVSWNGGGFALASLSDSGGNVYTHVPGFPVTNPNNIVDDFWVAYNIVASPNNKITATFGAGTAQPVYMQISEYSGLATSNGLDVFSKVSRPPNWKQTCTLPCTLSSAPSTITTQASELLVAVFDLINCTSLCSSVQFTTGTGWSPDAVCTACIGWSAQTVTGAVLIEHQLVSSIGSYTATAGENVQSFPNYNVYLFAFKRATGP